MKPFKDYARYYDLLYRDKDYAAEAQFVHQLIQKHTPGARSILELGCGSGAHAECLAKLGYLIHAVDLSAEMLEAAQKRQAGMDPEQADLISFTHGNIHNIDLGKKFDAVIALFHVMSYQIGNTDLKNSFATAKNHLDKKGVFIFDYWYGPAVLTDRPSVRVKRLADEAISIVRLAEPVMSANDNQVQVNYQVFTNDHATGTHHTFQESHHLRYLFKPELDWLMEETGFQHVEFGEWQTGREPGYATWYVYSVASL
jgi:SAM-dependent methyltransferase